MIGRRRDKPYIMAEIVEIAEDGIFKTQLMYRANISFTQLNDYIGFMLEIGLLEKTKENNRDVYRTTDKGKDFLQRYRQIAELLKDPEDRNVKTIVRKPKFLENR